MVRALEHVSTDEAHQADSRRSLVFRWSPRDRMLRLSGRLPEADGALVSSAVQAIAEQSAAPSSGDPEPEPWDARCADALVELCACSGAAAPAEPEARRSEAGVARPEAHSETTRAEPEEPAAQPEDERTTAHAAVEDDDTPAGPGNAADTDGTSPTGKPARRTEAEPVRAEIVVHVEAGVLAEGGDGAAALECGPPVAAETVRRLACDGWIRAVVEGPDRPLGVGRRQRTVPRSLLRALRHRDGGCRFPGCTHTRWVQAHHQTHWADGGPTDLENLVLLCGAHHRFVHEGGWRIEGDPSGELGFVHPDGRELRVGPPGLRPEVAERFGITLGDGATIDVGVESHWRPQHGESPP
jgi:hypothetical protein